VIRPTDDVSPDALRVRAHLWECARRREVTNYGKVAVALGFQAGGLSTPLRRALVELMESDQTAGRPFLSALAVNKKLKMSGPGFFDTAARLRGCWFDNDDEQERIFWEKEKNRVFETWGNDQ
jgi:hypothetical protein